MKNQWFISIKKNDGDIFDISGLKHNYPPKGFYWADPFLWQHNGKDYVFYEYYDYTLDREKYMEKMAYKWLYVPKSVKDNPMEQPSYVRVFKHNKKMMEVQ